MRNFITHLGAVTQVILSPASSGFNLYGRCLCRPCPSHCGRQQHKRRATVIRGRTHRLADPTLVWPSIGKLLQTYREGPPEQRERVAAQNWAAIKAKTRPAVTSTALPGLASAAMPEWLLLPLRRFRRLSRHCSNPGTRPLAITRINCCVRVDCKQADQPLQSRGLYNSSMGGGFLETTTRVRPAPK